MENENRGQNKLVMALLIALVAVFVDYFLDFIPMPLPYNPYLVWRMVLGAVCLGGTTAIYSKFISHSKINTALIIIIPIIISVIDVVIETYSFNLYGVIFPIRLAIRFVLYFICAFIMSLAEKKCDTVSSQAKKQGGNSGTLEIIAICFFVILGVLVEYVVITSGAVGLTWIGGIFGFIAIYMGVRLPGTVLKRNFIKLGNFGGMTYEQIAAVVGPCNSETPTVMGNGDSVIVRQWIRTGYHISLVFKDNICIGKNHEVQV